MDERFDPHSPLYIYAPPPPPPGEVAVYSAPLTHADIESIIDILKSNQEKLFSEFVFGSDLMERLNTHMSFEIEGHVDDKIDESRAKIIRAVTKAIDGKYQDIFKDVQELVRGLTKSHNKLVASHERLKKSVAAAKLKRINLEERVEKHAKKLERLLAKDLSLQDQIDILEETQELLREQFWASRTKVVKKKVGK